MDWIGLGSDSNDVSELFPVLQSLKKEEEMETKTKMKMKPSC